VFDGTELATNYIGYWDDFFPSSLASRCRPRPTVGATTTWWRAHSISTTTSGLPVYRVVARGVPRLPRLQFAKLSAARPLTEAVPRLLRAAAVELANGTTGSRQAWYDSATRRGQWWQLLRHERLQPQLYMSSWVPTIMPGLPNPANPQAHLWYPWCEQTRETGQEDQAAAQPGTRQLHQHYYNSRREGRLEPSGRQPDAGPTVIGMWSGTGGHAICPYATAVSGN